MTVAVEATRGADCINRVSKIKEKRKIDLRVGALRRTLQCNQIALITIPS